MAKRYGSVGWDTAGVDAGSFGRDGSWRVVHDRGGCLYRFVCDV